MISQLIAPIACSMMINIGVANPLSLNDALSQGLIEVSVQSEGGYSGKCIKLHVKSNTKKKYSLILEPGDVFYPDENENQNILVVEEQVLAMEDVQDDFRVEGFCCESSDHSPGEGDSFKFGKIENDKLIKLADYISGKEISNESKQSAIWAVSDGESISAIYPKNEKDKELRKFVCDLTGQDNVWFNTQNNYSVTEDRTIVREPTLITGEVNYKVTAPGKIYCSVYNADGEVKLELVKGSPIPYAANLSFEFEGKVKGWQSGDYYVKVFLDDKEIHSQKFTV